MCSPPSNRNDRRKKRCGCARILRVCIAAFTFRHRILIPVPLLLIGADANGHSAVRGQVLAKRHEPTPGHAGKLLHKIDAVIPQEIGLDGVPDAKQVYFFALSPGRLERLSSSVSSAASPSSSSTPLIRLNVFCTSALS